MMRTLVVFGAAAGTVVGFARAQQSTDPNQTQPVQPQIIHTAPSKPLSGVPSAAPQVSPPIGVPSRSTPVPTTPIVRTPGPVLTTPVPSVPVVTPIDNTRSGLVRRMLDARYGPGYSLVDGQVVKDPAPMKPMTGGWPAGSSMPTTWAVPAYYPADGTIRGYYNNGRDFRLGFSIGNNFPVIQSGWDSSYGKYPARLYRSYYSPWEDWDRYRNNPCSYNPYMIVGGDAAYVIDPRLTSAAPDMPVRELTPLEKAELALKGGDAADAVKQFKLHLRESPDDAGVERMLAIALIDDRKVDQGVAVLIHAYMKQPHLAQDALEPRTLSGGDLDHRHRFTQVMDYASRVKTGSSYFAAAVLAQSEGRFDTAKRMLERAIATGLDKKVAEEMKVALATR